MGVPTAGDMKKLCSNKDAETIAMSVMDAAMKFFNEDNFYYYDFSIRMAHIVAKFVSDGILTKEKGNEVHRELAKTLNNMIHEAKFKEE